MASTRRKAAAVAIAIVGIAGLSLASAAQLQVTSDTLQAGSVNVSSCDADGVNVGYTTQFASSAYGVSGVTVSGIDVETTTTPASCTGRTLEITLYNAAGTSMGTQTKVIGAASEALTVSVASARDVTGVAVVIR